MQMPKSRIISGAIISQGVQSASSGLEVFPSWDSWCGMIQEKSLKLDLLQGIQEGSS